MAIVEKEVMEFLAVPVDRKELEALYFERSEELLQMKAFLKSKELLLTYQLAIELAELEREDTETR